MVSPPPPGSPPGGTPPQGSKAPRSLPGSHGDARPAAQAGPALCLCLRGSAVGTAPFFCLTSEVSAGKLSSAVCKQPFPLLRAACQALPAASLAHSRLTQAARPGTGLPPGSLGSWLGRAVPAALGALQPREGAPAPRRVPPGASAVLKAPQAQEESGTTPLAGRHRRGNSRALGRR